MQVVMLINFLRVKNDFQKKLKNDMKVIKSSSNTQLLTKHQIYIVWKNIVQQV